MSFFSYKNANAEVCPGTVAGNVTRGLDQRVCIQVKNVYDSCMQQEQLDDIVVTVADIVPVLPDKSCHPNQNRPCNCSGNSCVCQTCASPISYEEAVVNATQANCLPQPQGYWAFESCRSSTTNGSISNLTVDRLCDRPQFARVRGIVNIPIDILFTDDACQEWMGRGNVAVVKDVLLAIPDESIVPFTLESLVSAICVTGTYIGNCQFKVTICVTIVLKILAEVELMIPTYGFCQVPPCEEFAENVCDEFFSLPLFPQQASCIPNDVEVMSVCGNTGGSTGGCGCSGGCGVGNVGCSGFRSNCACTCSKCGTTCASMASQCPRCGCAMTPNA